MPPLPRKILAFLLVPAFTGLAILAVVFYRATVATPAPPPAAVALPIDIDGEKAAERLSQAVRFPTVSSDLSLAATVAAFRQFHIHLRREYPLVHSRLSREEVGLSLLYTWKGKNPSAPALMLAAHQDVVPPGDPAAWQELPFGGKITQSQIWGRGTLDDKVSVLGILEAVEALLAKGFEPERTIYLAFGHDEETGGDEGAKKIAKLLAGRNVRLATVLDEGGFVTVGMMPGLNAPLAIVGTAEKGYANLELSAVSQGGHSSVPPKKTVIGSLARALDKLVEDPMPSKLVSPAREMFAALTPHLTFGRRVALANLWLFQPFVVGALESLPTTAATVRTTQAPTVFQSGEKDNVLPATGRAIVNYRLLPGDTETDVISHAKRVIADDSVSLRIVPPFNTPSRVSSPDSKEFKALAATTQTLFPGAVVVPALSLGGTDSRHYEEIADQTYRFLPIPFTDADTRRMHGLDERVGVADYARLIRFYGAWITQVAGMSEKPGAS